MIISVFVSSCGLPSSNVADAPVVRSTSAFSVEFSAPAEDTSIFGYEIYYKIYNATDTSSIETDRLKFDTDLSSYDFESGDKKPDSLKFNRLNIGDLFTPTIKSIPVVSVDDLSSGDIVTISIGPGSGTDGNGIISINGLELIPLRIVLDDIYYKPFLNNVLSGDTDNNGVLKEDNQYSVSFVAYSYVSSIITTSQSSYPVFLGTITDIPNN